jgi:hypothetical protein
MALQPFQAKGKFFQNPPQFSGTRAVQAPLAGKEGQKGEIKMNYRLNLALMLAVFSIVTYNVCAAYEDMSDVAIEEKFQTIGLLEGNNKAAFIIPPRKPDIAAHQLASL